MPVDQHNHLQELLQQISDYWIIITGTVTSVVGSVLYVLKQKFATIEALEHCKRQTVKEFHTALDEQKIHMMTVNQHAHDSLKETITIILDRVDDVDEKLDNLKNSLLHREWFK